MIISEFAVEFVQEKLETPFDSQLAAAPATPVTIGFSLFGLGRVQIDFAEEDARAISNHIYALFVEELERAGFEVVPHDQAMRSAIFEQLAASGETRPSPVLQKFNAFATDTGRIKEIYTVTPEGLALLDDANGVTIEQAELGVLQAIEVDRVVRARFRVGIYRGLLSVEQDSLIMATANDRLETIKAQRSLLSPTPAVDPKNFETFRGDVFRIDPTRFLEALDQTFPPYARLGIRRWMNH